MAVVAVLVSVDEVAAGSLGKLVMRYPPSPLMRQPVNLMFFVAGSGERHGCKRRDH